MSSRKISCNKKALNQLNKAIDYIANDSIKNAKKVIVDMLEKINKFSGYPEIHPPDKFKVSNNGNYRAFELHKYRIAYYLSSEEIRILRILNTGMETQNY